MRHPTELEKAILTVISRYNGKIGWYGIANSLPSHGFIAPRNLLEILRMLVQEGLLSKSDHEQYPGGVFGITELGLAILSEEQDV